MGRIRATEPVFFERLCLLRALYARRGARDRQAVMSVDAALDHADALLRDPECLERALQGRLSAERTDRAAP